MAYWFWYWVFMSSAKADGVRSAIALRRTAALSLLSRHGDTMRIYWSQNACSRGKSAANDPHLLPSIPKRPCTFMLPLGRAPFDRVGEG